MILKRTLTYHSILTRTSWNVFLVFVFLFFSLISRAQINPLADSSKMLYKNDLKYIGSSTSIDPNYRYVMEELIDILKANPLATIHVRGHVCCGPNNRISFKRARNIFKLLVAEGISRTRISFAGYSDELPLAYPEKTEADEIINRRVDFVLNFNP